MRWRVVLASPGVNIDAEVEATALDMLQWERAVRSTPPRPPMNPFFVESDTSVLSVTTQDDQP